MENGQKPDPISRRPTVKDFTDLETWQYARHLRWEVYRTTRSFPRDETYGLTSQMRCSSVSITANITEGFGRFSYQENVQFCRQSRVSAYELRDHLTTALDQGYISKDAYDRLNAAAISVTKLLNAYIRSTLKRRETALVNSGSK